VTPRSGGGPEIFLAHRVAWGPGAVRVLVRERPINAIRDVASLVEKRSLNPKDETLSPARAPTPVHALSHQGLGLRFRAPRFPFCHAINPEPSTPNPKEIPNPTHCAPNPDP